MQESDPGAKRREFVALVGIDGSGMRMYIPRCSYTRRNVCSDPPKSRLSDFHDSHGVGGPGSRPITVRTASAESRIWPTSARG